MSVRRKASAHGRDIRRLVPASGAGSADSAPLGVRSTVSGFLDGNYYTSNDSVPLVHVSESFSRLFQHTSDEDTDSEVEEFMDKKYGTEAKNLRDALKLNFNIRKTATGIPRMEGHMRLPDRKTAQSDAKDLLYRGTSYLVEAPLRLERSTRALTRTAIARAVDGERSRRMSEIQSRGAAVSSGWLEVQRQLKQVARLAEEEENEATIAATQATEGQMDLVREQLVREVHRKTVREEVTEAQQWKQMFFKGIAKNKLSPEAMEAVASTSEHMSSVLSELSEAFSCSELDEGSREEVAVERSLDLMDACLNELLRCVLIQTINIEVTIERERQMQEFKRGRPAAARKSQSDDGPDVGSTKQEIGNSVAKIFKRVNDREIRREERVIDRASEYKCLVQEDLIRKVWQRRVTRLCSHEKARRIIEAEDPATMEDPTRIAVSDHWVRVQAQMVIDKFRAKKPMNRSLKEVLHTEGGEQTSVGSALDQRLRAVRNRFRRPAVYVCRAQRHKSSKAGGSREERRQVADQREQDRNKRPEKKRSRSHSQVEGQYRSHWTARIRK
ncbi:uncharacterized protein LOC119109821 [Pollicipes pollicipes]|uniref:uncharacterized protein LOC119109821 n=1 Tax=Pollicipes pollicipes TaxID=41117 RepID=UPI00188580EC|nr:uncharacterized protein LOC119109821 [Pollicipes pollicipes]